MFVDLLERYNPNLITAAHAMHREGQAEPDTYIIDMDSILHNAQVISSTASRYGVRLYFMSKQLGRNPFVALRVIDTGMDGAVAVDVREAQTLSRGGVPVRHVGNLVQIPEGMLDSVLDMKPEVVTVFSAEKAAAVSEAAVRRGIVQGIMLRTRGDDDIVYPSQEGGFSLYDIKRTVPDLLNLKGIRIAGLTSFPCFLFNEATKRAEPSPNLFTVLKAKELIEREFGLGLEQINLPSSTSPETIPKIAALGGTHGEPGHSVSGTNPENIYCEHPLPPALVYLTEVSHHTDGDSLCFGGGYYRRSHLEHALVCTESGIVRTDVSPPPPESIDYYIRIRGRFPPGSCVIMCFRTQIFVTRSRVALVEGVRSGDPRLLGVWDSLGRSISAEAG
jgi:predicted amino acid racemase